MKTFPAIVIMALTLFAAFSMVKIYDLEQAIRKNTEDCRCNNVTIEMYNDSDAKRFKEIDDSFKFHREIEGKLAYKILMLEHNLREGLKNE